MTNERKQRILCLVTDENGEYYYNGPLDGIWGPESKKAADRFLADFTGEEQAEAESGDFWDEIEYFTREEFRCKCGGKYCNGFPAEPREDLVRLANAARKHFGKTATVISGLRCETWNSLTKNAAENSQHKYGEACDLKISGVTADELLSFFQGRSGVRYAYKINETNVHFDVPQGKR